VWISMRCEVCKEEIIENGVTRWGTKPPDKKLRLCVECYRVVALGVHSPPFTGVASAVDPSLAPVPRPGRPE